MAFAFDGAIRRGLGAKTKPTAFAPARTAARASPRRVMPQILTNVDPFKLRSPVELRGVKLRSPVELRTFKLRSPVELRGVPSFSVAVAP